MKTSNLFIMAALSLLVSLAACSNEELQSESPDGKVELKDGEMAVKMNISGLGQSVASRAGNSIAVPGESTINSLDVYCFVNLSKSTTSGIVVSSEDYYTLEHAYTYLSLGNDNDLLLNSLGTGYQATFGVLKDEFKRIFVLVANKKNDVIAPVAISLATAGLGGDRSGATTWSDFQTWVTSSNSIDNVKTPLLMQSIAGRTENGKFNPIYTKDELENGISAELKRVVARIDIKNPKTTQFNITKVVLTNSRATNLFAGYSTVEIPAATAPLTGYFSLTEHSPITTGLNEEMILGALYPFPVKADNKYFPKVSITGTYGIMGEITVDAKFDGIASVPSGFKPNTRYVVNLLNSEGNLTANITVANWETGESVDSEDVIEKLNSAATLIPEQTTSWTNYKFDNKTLYCFSSNSPIDAKMATIEGAPGDSKPIGIIMETDRFKIVDNGNTGTNGARKYTLYSTTFYDPTLAKTKLSLVSYDPTTKKQVVNEYLLYQDNVNANNLSVFYDEFRVYTPNGIINGEDISIYRIPPFGLLNVAICSYQEGNPIMLSYGVNVEIPKNCNWIGTNMYTTSTSREVLLCLNVDNNIGGNERSAVIQLQKRDINAPFGFVTKNVTIVQEQGKTIDPTLLSDSYTISCASNAKMEGNVISVLKSRETTIRVTTPETPNYEVYPKLLLFSTPNPSWIKGGDGEYAFNNSSVYPDWYQMDISVSAVDSNTKDGSFTITTSKDGALVTDTYTVKRVDSLP